MSGQSFYSRLFRTLLTVVVLYGALIVTTQPGFAQERLDVPGYDVVLLVDQSGSMGGSEIHPTANDRLGLRFEAPEDFVTLIGEDAIISNRTSGSNATHRLAVVDFGTTVQRSLDWTVWDPKDYDQLKTGMQTLTSGGGGLGTDRLLTSNLGDTNFPAAFSEAQALLAELPEGESGRVRVVILLTDGFPCVWNGTNCGDQQGQMNQVQEYVRQFGGENLRIYVIAMNDSDRNYWPDWGDDWTAITGEGRARKVDSNDDVGRFFHDIVVELRSLLPGTVGISSVPINPGKVAVPPYLDSIDFSLFKSNPDETLEVRDPANRLINASADPADVEEGGNMIYRIKVFQPEPGFWTISTKNSAEGAIDIVMQQVIAQGTLTSPPNVVVQYAPTSIAWELRDSRGNALPKYDDPRYALQPLVTVSSTVGELTTVTLEQSDDGSYVASFIPIDTGAHTINMQAVSQDIVGREIEVFNGRVSDILVSPVKLKASDLASAPAQFTPVTLSFVLQTEQGMPVPDLGSSLTISATVQAGGQTFPLTLRPSGGKYTGEFVPMSAGGHQVTAATTIMDPNGFSHSVDQGVVALFNVTPTRLQAVKQPANATLFEEQELVYEFVDSSNNPVAVANDIGVEAHVIGADATTSLATRRTEEGQIAANFVPKAEGRHDMEMTVVRNGVVGRLAQATPEVLGSIDVQRPKIAKIAPGATSPQYKPMRIAYQVRDNEGDVWQLAPGHRLQFSLTLGYNGVATQPFDLSPVDDSTYETTYTPNETGNHAIRATADVIQPDGGVYEVYSDADLPLTVNVQETMRVGLKLIQPTTGITASQYIDRLAPRFSGIPFLEWFSEPTPMRIQVQLQGEDGVALSPSQVFSGNVAMPIALEVLQGDSTVNYSDRFVLNETSAGIFTAEASDLPTIDYLVKAGFAPGLTPLTEYDFDPAARSAQGKVTLGLNPYVVGVRAIVGSLVVVLVVGGVFNFVRRRNLRRHPVRGMLTVEDDRGIPLDNKVIAGRNRLKLTEFKATTHIKWMEVTCRNDSDSRAGIVQVHGRLDDGSSFGGQLAPGPSRMPLGKYKTYLTKPQ